MTADAMLWNERSSLSHWDFDPERKIFAAMDFLSIGSRA
jgi:hypothetical protein